jgi:hypothetical protein
MTTENEAPREERSPAEAIDRARMLLRVDDEQDGSLLVVLHGQRIHEIDILLRSAYYGMTTDRADLLRLAGPICPHDGRYAVEHIVSPTTGAYGLPDDVCTWWNRQGRCGLHEQGHDAAIDEAIGRDHSAQSAHGYESVAAHEFAPEVGQWLRERSR